MAVTKREPGRGRLRHPAVALPAAIGFGLLAAFFAWQSAEPLWLSLGHGVTGTAEVTRCQAIAGAEPGAEVAPEPGSAPEPGRVTAPTYPCVVFEAADGGFRATDVTLLGAGQAAGTAGATVPARMVAADRDRAYAADPAGLHLRWSVGLLLVLACGGGTAWATGGARLDGRRVRWRATLLSFGGPLLLAAGFLVAAL